MLFDGVVDPLNEHAGQVGLLQQIGHSSAVTKRVYGPPTARSYTCDSEKEASISALHSDEKEGTHLSRNHSPQLEAAESSTKYFIT